MTPEEVNVWTAAIQALVKPATILTEGCTKGCSALFNLVVGRKKSDDEVYDMLNKAYAQKQIEKLEGGTHIFENGEISPLRQDQPSLFPPIIDIGRQQEASNLSGNIRVAAEFLSLTPDEDISDDDVNPDWFARWRETAKLTSEKDMQQLWGTILAEEIKSPGGISYRTLEVLKNITSDEAQLFQKVTPLIIVDQYIVFTKHAGSTTALELVDLLKLNESGLISSSDDLSYSIDQQANGRFSIPMLNVGLVVECTKTLSIPVVPLSTAGKEMLSIITADKTNLEHYNHLKKHILHDNQDGVIQKIILTEMVENGADLNSVIFEDQ